MKYLITAVMIILCAPVCAQIRVDADFAGGNVVIDKISSDTVYFRPDLTGTQGKWFYWYFRATSDEPQTWYFKATQNNILTSLGANYSKDGGYTWQTIGPDEHLGTDLFAHTFTRADQSVRFSFGQPYTQRNFDRFMKKYRFHPQVKISTLCQSNKGREVEQILISNFEHEPVYKILFVARNHACEMMTNYIVEGIIDALLSGAPEMNTLLAKTEIMIIPFVDKDGVEEGDQGKNRLPRDHNRDYSGTSLYTTTAAIRKKIPEWAGNTPWVAIDLHNPGIKGEGHEKIFFVGKSQRRLHMEQKKLARILANTRRGPLSFDESHNFLEFGASWNKSTSYLKGWPFSEWAASYFRKGLLVTTTLEFPYALNGPQPITAQNTRYFGKDLIYALSHYLMQNKHSRKKK